MIEYISALVTAIGTAVAIRGETWDGSRTAWKKVTITGWIAISVLLCGLGITLSLAIQAQQLKQTRQELLYHKLAPLSAAVVGAFESSDLESVQQSCIQLGDVASQYSDVIPASIGEKIARLWTSCVILGDGVRSIKSLSEDAWEIHIMISNQIPVAGLSFCYSPSIEPSQSAAPEI